MKGNDDINLLSISNKHTNAPVSNQLGVTWESLLTTLYWEFLWFMSTKNFIIEFLWGKKMVWFYRMLCRNNGRLYEHEYNLKCLALKETSHSLKKKWSLYSFPSLAFPFPTPSPSVLTKWSLHYGSYCGISFSQRCSPQTGESFLWCWLISELSQSLIWSCGTKCYTVTIKG